LLIKTQDVGIAEIADVGTLAAGTSSAYFC
jgi:hypothetical protein